MITEIFVSNFTPLTDVTFIIVVWLLKIVLTITVHDIGDEETPLARRGPRLCDGQYQK